MKCPKCGSEMDYKEDIVDLDDMGSQGYDCFWLCEKCGHEEKIEKAGGQEAMTNGDV